MIHIRVLQCDIHMPRCKEHVETMCTPESIAAPFDFCYTVGKLLMIMYVKQHISICSK